MTDICCEEDNRRTLFPIRHPELWKIYKKHEAAIWTAEEIDLSKDINEILKEDGEPQSKSEDDFGDHLTLLFGDGLKYFLDGSCPNFQV